MTQCKIGSDAKHDVSDRVLGEEVATPDVKHISDLEQDVNR